MLINLKPLRSILSCLLHPQSPTHLSTLIPSQGESSRELMRSCLMEVLHESSYTDTMDSLCSRLSTEYLANPRLEAPLEDHPLPADALPTTLSPGYVTDSDQDEDPEEDPEEDHADYPADEGDGDDEPSDDDDDDDDTDDEDEEPFKDEDDDKDVEHLAPANSSAIPCCSPCSPQWGPLGI
ncbi:hypothetical protein Tco_0071296 [Tanacetum coccineum]